MLNQKLSELLSNSRQTKKGFTLIELLVVVAIIALLIAILLPSLAKARGRARTAACGSNTRQLAIACNVYAGEYGGQFPPSGLVYDGNNTAFVTWYYFESLLTGKYTYQGAFLQPYTQGQKVLFCPEMLATQPNIAPVVGSATNGNLITHYGMAVVAATLSAQVTNPTETASFGDSINWTAFMPGAQLKSAATILRPSADTQGGFFHGRHNGGVGNAAFQDGHVEALRAQLKPPVPALFGTFAAWQSHQTISAGSLCYGTMNPGSADTASSAAYAAYCKTSNLDYYFYYDKMEKN